MSIDRYRKAVALSDEIYKKLRELEDITEIFDDRTHRRVEVMRSEFVPISGFISEEAHQVEFRAYNDIMKKAKSKE
jgi:hypothetical protein